jgi:transposase-like protein
VSAQPGAVPCPVPLTLFCIDFALSHDHQRPCLWRAVDQDGNTVDILLRRQDKKAAKKFFRKLLKGLAYVLRVIITDKLNPTGLSSARFSSV